MRLFIFLGHWVYWCISFHLFTSMSVYIDFLIINQSLPSSLYSHISLLSWKGTLPEHTLKLLCKHMKAIFRSRTHCAGCYPGILEDSRLRKKNHLKDKTELVVLTSYKKWGGSMRLLGVGSFACASYMQNYLQTT